MTIADKLALLEQTKEAQRVKLGLPKNIPFSRYHEFFERKFVPSYLFFNGEQGVWFDPSDLKTMFQDVNGLEPVTKDGDPVALIRDKSGNNNHATQATASARPIYRTDGNLHWLEFDGVDDTLSTLNKVTLRQPITMSCALSRTPDTSTTNLFGVGHGSLGRFQIISISSGRVSGYVRKLSGEYTGAGDSSSNSFPKDTSAVLTALLTDSSVIMRRNGGGETRGSLGAVNGIDDKYRVISINNSASTHSQKFYGGVVILDTSLEGTKEIIDLELFLAQKSGVTL